MSDVVPWSKHYDDANTADKLSRMALADGNLRWAEHWKKVAEQKQIDGDRALERQVPRGWSK